MEYSEEKVQAIFDAMEDETVAEAIRNAQSKEEIVAIFAGKGIDIDDGAAQSAFDKVKTIRENDGELSIEDLELVAGGINWKKFACGAGIAALGAAAVLALPATAATAAGAGLIGVGIGICAYARREK